MDREFEAHLAPNCYFDHNLNSETVKILPGEYFATTRDIVIVTVLGSCVSVCLRDRVSGIGGMNHFMLPGSSDDSLSPVSSSARYGVYAMELLINHLLKLGAQRHNFEAKVFGGGSVLRGLTINNIGQLNVNFVLDYLRTEGVQITAQDLLETYPRKVYFFPANGRVLVKKLMSLNNTTLIEREHEYSMQIRKVHVAGTVDLF